MASAKLKDIDFDKIKEAGAIRKEIMWTQQRGRMNIINVIGLPGTGKSWMCLRLAELLAQDFHADNYKITSRNVVDNLLDLLKFIRAIKIENEIVICEEIGVWLSSRRAMSSVNVDAGYVWDTLRKKRVIVITNNPIQKHIDSKLLVLTSMMVQTLSLNKRLGVCMVKPLRLQTNPDTAKTYRHRLKENGYEVHRCWVGKPSKELTDDYERDKDSFLDKLYKKLESKHEDKMVKESRKLITGIEYVPTQLEKDRYDLHKKGLANTEIARIHGVDPSAIGRSIKKYKAKVVKLTTVIEE